MKNEKIYGLKTDTLKIKAANVNFKKYAFFKKLLSFVWEGPGSRLQDFYDYKENCLKLSTVSAAGGIFLLVGHLSASHFEKGLKEFLPRIFVWGREAYYVFFHKKTLQN